jgi:hypothetical protein
MPEPMPEPISDPMPPGGARVHTQNLRRVVGATLGLYRRVGLVVAASSFGLWLVVLFGLRATVAPFIPSSENERWFVLAGVLLAWLMRDLLSFGAAPGLLHLVSSTRPGPVAPAPPAPRPSPGARGLAATALLRLPGALAAWAIASALALGGLALLVVPGALVLVSTWLMMPVAAVEGGSPLAILARSRALVAGRRWLVFGLALGLSALDLGVRAITSGLVFGPPGSTELLIGAALVPALTDALRACAQVALYAECLGGRERAGTGPVANVFE